MLLVFLDLSNALFHRGGHGLMHRRKIGSFHEIGRPSVTDEEGLELFVTDSGKYGWVVDLEAD